MPTYPADGPLSVCSEVRLPVYSTIVKVSIGEGLYIWVRSGTQYIDGFWQHLRKEVGTTARTLEDACMRKVRAAQWRRWLQGRDVWECLGESMQYVI
eukprot:5521643-Amphidinium_carterae.1